MHSSHPNTASRKYFDLDFVQLFHPNSKDLVHLMLTSIICNKIFLLLLKVRRPMSQLAKEAHSETNRRRYLCHPSDFPRARRCLRGFPGRNLREHLKGVWLCKDEGSLARKPQEFQLHALLVITMRHCHLTFPPGHIWYWSFIL